MTLQGSGEISLYDIAAELGWEGDPPYSLRSMANEFGLSTPDALSDFYGLSYNYFNVTPGSNTNYYDTGSAYSPQPDYEIDASEGWYGVVDDVEISGLDFSVLYDEDGYVASAQFPTSVGSNSSNYTRAGGVTFYKNSDDSWFGSIGACQDGYAEYCS